MRRALLVVVVLMAIPASPGRASASRLRHPVLFVHGNGDSAALWHTTLWRFESNGYDRSLLRAVDMPHPAAPLEDSRAEPNRSTTAQQTALLAEEVERFLSERGVDRLVLVGSSRGGNAIRDYVKNAGGHERVALVVLCSTPNHGVTAQAEGLDSEWNGMGHFLSRLNQGSEVHPDVPFVTLRSDRSDKYAQPTGEFLGRPGAPTGVGYDGPELEGATNIVLPGLDHREVAFHPRAFREMYRAVTGEWPDSIEIEPEEVPVLDGTVSGFDNGEPTNLPLTGARVEVFEVSAETGERQAGAIHSRETEDTGRWGPFRARPDAYYEIVVSHPDYLTHHFYRTPFPRSTVYVHLRLGPPPLPPESAGKGESLVTLTRPRGYLGHGRDRFTIDGDVPDGVNEGVPGTSMATRRFPASPPRSVRVVLNEEAMVVRTCPFDEGHWVIAEFHY